MSRILKWIVLRFKQIPAYLLWPAMSVIILLFPGPDYDKYRYSLLSHLIIHWPLGILLVVVGLMLAGRFGTRLGLPTLFRDDPDRTEWLGRPFGGGFGVALLASTVWTVIFFCNFIDFQERVEGLKKYSPRDATSRRADPIDGHHPENGAQHDGNEGVRAAVRHLLSYLRGDSYVKRLFDDLGESIKDLRNMVVDQNTTLPEPLDRLNRDAAEAKRELSKSRGRPLEDDFQPTEIMNHLDRIREDARDVEKSLNSGTSDHRDQATDEKVHDIRHQILYYKIEFHRSRLLFCQCAGTASFLVFFVGCFGITTPELAKRRRCSGKRFVALHEFGRFLCGIVSFIIILIIFDFIVLPIIYNCIAHLLLHEQSTDEWLSRLFRYFTRFQNPMDGSLGLVFIVSSIAVLSLVLNRFTVSAGLGICLLFSVLAILYLFLVAIHPSSQLLVVGGVAVGLIWLNSSPYKYRFPGMERYYESPCNLHEEDDEIERVGAKHRPGPLDDSGEHELLDDREVLKAWAGQLQKAQGGRKPKLVLVTATGGAYRASFWTTTVLERLACEPALAGFLNHVRLITGASGGMVGAAYVVAMLEQPKPGDGYSTTVDATEQLKTDCKGDSLSAVVQRLIGGDLPRALWPRAQTKDRGRTLEDQWKKLDQVTFKNLREGEKAGWRPSLILSPMIVETGRRLLFSNLDLYGLTDIQARNRKRVSIEKEDLDSLPAKGGHRRLSRSAVEFFRAFPEVYRSFQVKVAVRMNASFPYVSPAVSLPVDPPRRVVDAAYYDNYGVNLAAAWAFMNREWIREHTSGLALVQIRAYESEAVRKRLWGKDQLLPRLIRRLTIGAHALSTPLHGVTSAVEWSMSYRNDEQVSLLGQTFNTYCEIGEGDDWKCVDRNQRKGKNGWFETFIFENPLSFGMNWLITNGEIDEMKSCFDPDIGLQDQNNWIPSRNNLDQLERLKAWWQDQQAPTEDAAAAGSDGEANGRTPSPVPAPEDGLLVPPINA